MSGQLSFIKEYETYCPQIKAYNDRNECMQIHVRFPIVMTDLSGSKKRIRYARVEKTEDGTQVAQARSEDMDLLEHRLYWHMICLLLLAEMSLMSP